MMLKNKLKKINIDYLILCLFKNSYIDHKNDENNYKIFISKLNEILLYDRIGINNKLLREYQYILNRIEYSPTLFIIGDVNNKKIDNHINSINVNNNKFIFCSEFLTKEKYDDYIKNCIDDYIKIFDTLRIYYNLEKDKKYTYLSNKHTSKIYLLPGDNTTTFLEKLNEYKDNKNDQNNQNKQTLDAIRKLSGINTVYILLKNYSTKFQEKVIKIVEKENNSIIICMYDNKYYSGDFSTNTNIFIKHPKIFILSYDDEFFEIYDCTKMRLDEKDIKFDQPKIYIVTSGIIENNYLNSCIFNFLPTNNSNKIDVHIIRDTACFKQKLNHGSLNSDVINALNLCTHATSYDISGKGPLVSLNISKTSGKYINKNTVDIKTNVNNIIAFDYDMFMFIYPNINLTFNNQISVYNRKKNIKYRFNLSEIDSMVNQAHFNFSDMITNKNDKIEKIIVYHLKSFISKNMGILDQNIDNEHCINLIDKIREFISSRQTNETDSIDVFANKNGNLYKIYMEYKKINKKNKINSYHIQEYNCENNNYPINRSYIIDNINEQIKSSDNQVKIMIRLFCINDNYKKVNFIKNVLSIFIKDSDAVDILSYKLYKHLIDISDDIEFIQFIYLYIHLYQLDGFFKLKIYDNATLSIHRKIADQLNNEYNHKNYVDEKNIINNFTSLLLGCNKTSTTLITSNLISIIDMIDIDIKENNDFFIMELYSRTNKTNNSMHVKLFDDNDNFVFIEKPTNNIDSLQKISEHLYAYIPKGTNIIQKMNNILADLVKSYVMSMYSY